MKNAIIKTQLSVKDTLISVMRINNIDYISLTDLARYKNSENPGDVIITIMGTVGISAVIPDDMPKAINTKHLACLTPNIKLVDSYFLTNAFQIHPVIRGQLKRQCKGAIMDGLNLTIIKGLKFKLPPLGLQKEFVQFYKQVDKSKLLIFVIIAFIQSRNLQYRFYLR